MLGLTILLVVAAVFIFVVFRKPTARRRGEAADAARRAVEAKLNPPRRETERDDPPA